VAQSKQAVSYCDGGLAWASETVPGLPAMPSHARHATSIAKVITQRRLRNESGEIMGGLDRGESYQVRRR